MARWVYLQRIVVMRRGRISAEFGPDTPKEDIMAASGEAVVTAHSSDAAA